MGKVITLPIKCSNLKKFEQVLEVILGTLVLIYSVVSLMWLIGLFIGINSALTAWDTVYLIISTIGTAIFITLAIAILKDNVIPWVISNIPTLECIEDEVK